MNIVRSGANIILEAALQHKQTLIFLHGLGDSAEGYLPLFNSEMNFCPKTTKIVLLTAPVKPVTINMGMRMTSWYDIRDLNTNEDNFEKAVSLAEVEENAKAIIEVIIKEAKLLNNDYNKIFIGGFSQGCCLALYCGLQFSEKIGGIIGLSGFYFPNIKENEANKNTNVFIGHGKLDMLIPWSWAQKSYLKFGKERTVKISVDPNLEHSISQSELLAVKQFWIENWSPEK